MQQAAAVAVEVERPQPGETLVERIVIINAEGLVILQTISPPAGPRYRRSSRTETTSDEARLMHRLTELLPTLWRRDDKLAAAE